MSEEVLGEERLFSGYTGRLFLVITFCILALNIGYRLLPPLLPIIIEDLMTTPFDAGLALSIMAIARAVLQFPSGRFSDRLSRLTIILIGIIFGLAGLGLIMRSEIYISFILGVTVLGIGQGFYDPSARAFLSDIFIRKRGRAFGVHFIAGDVAGVIAAVMAIIATASWRATFIPPILLLIPLPILLVRWSHESIILTKVDLKLGSTARRLISVPRLRLAIISYSLIVFASIGMTNFLAAFLIEVHGFSIEIAGASYIFLYSIGSVIKPIAGWASDQIPRLAVVSAGLFLASISMLVLLLTSDVVIIFVAIIGFAIGLRAFPAPFQAYLMDLFPKESMGGDLGAVRSLYMGIGSLGPAYVGYVASGSGYSRAYASTIVCLVIAGVISTYLSLKE